jgi:hypothetical protein
MVATPLAVVVGETEPQPELHGVFPCVSVHVTPVEPAFVRIAINRTVWGVPGVDKAAVLGFGDRTTETFDVTVTFELLPVTVGLIVEVAVMETIAGLGMTGGAV